MLNQATRIEVDDGSRRVYVGEERLTDEEREFAQALDEYMANPPSRGEQEAARRSRLRDYTGLGSGDAVTLAMRIVGAPGGVPDAPPRPTDGRTSRAGTRRSRDAVPRAP